MRVIFDTDPGNGFPATDVDDGLALGLLLNSPEVTLEAVTIVGGNTAVERGQRSALVMLELAGSEVPVFAGSRRPILENQTVWRRELDGRGAIALAGELWRSVTLPEPTRRVEDERAPDAIVRLVDQAPGALTIVAVGPLTNVATAMLLDPDLPRKVARIVVMGGNFGVPHTLQELNFGYDPEAARIVLTSGAPVTLIPLDTTLRTFLTLADNDRLIRSDRPLTRFLGITAEPWIRWVARREGRDGCALHDPLAVAALLDPSMVTLDRVRVDVALGDGLMRGRAVSWDPDDASLKEGLRLHTVDPIDVAVGVDNDRFVRFLLGRLLADPEV